MKYDVLLRLFLSGVVLLAVYSFFLMLKGYARNTQKKFDIRLSRYLVIRRILRTLSIFIGLFALLLVWEVNLKHVWINITGILAIVAIAFFAVWSLVGNLLAGIILYFTSPFKIEETIEIMPDEVRGKVLAINSFYTVMQDGDGNYINIPNSLFFQKYIRVIAEADRPVPVCAKEGNQQP